jgi:hypothetical protein
MRCKFAVFLIAAQIISWKVELTKSVALFVVYKGESRPSQIVGKPALSVIED